MTILSLYCKVHLYHTMASVQEGVSKACVSYYSRFRRSAHVTPKSFLNFIGSYKAVYAKQEEKIGVLSGRMNAGLDKLDEVMLYCGPTCINHTSNPQASKAVELLKKELAVMEKELAIANNKAEEVLVTVTERARESEAVKKSVMMKKEAAEAIVKAIQVDKVVAETALEAAKPALEEAEVGNMMANDNKYQCS